MERIKLSRSTLETLTCFKMLPPFYLKTLETHMQFFSFIVTIMPHNLWHVLPTLYKILILI